MLKCLLAPAAFLYKAGVTFRHRLFDWGILKSEKFDIPIICIGNITVGGTGKTPMAEMVIAYMSQMHNVALLSRGYGRRTKGYLEVRADSHYRDAGDEPLQIKLKFPDTVVAVCEKRSEGIRRICAEHPEVDLIVMDDGFQHRYVEPKINIVMIDATRPVQHDRMLPVGTLRDLPEELHRAHYFVVTKCPERMAPIDRRILRKVLIQVAYQRVYFTRFESFMPQPLYAEEASGEPLAQGRPVIALSGIGNPKPFVQTLRERYEVVAEMTLDEKIGQLTSPYGWEMYERHGDSVRLTDAFREAVQNGHIGMLWGTFRADPWTQKDLRTGLPPQLAARLANRMQRYAVQHSRLGIPLFLAEEAPHGHMAIGATTFPTAPGQASTWNPELIERMGEVIAAAL